MGVGKALLNVLQSLVLMFKNWRRQRKAIFNTSLSTAHEIIKLVAGDKSRNTPEKEQGK